MTAATGAFLATTLLAGTAGCRETSAVEAPRWVEPPIAEAPHHQGNHEQSQDTTDTTPGAAAAKQRGKPVIDLGKLAARPLTADVQQRIGSAAAINVHFSEEGGDVTVLASGVSTKYGYLSSGHDFRTETGAINRTCHDAAVISPQATANGAGSIAFSKAVSIQTVRGEMLKTTHATDISLISPSLISTGEQAPLYKQNHDLAVGTPVVSVNYEPTGSHSYRNPTYPGKHAAPAIFRGYVLSDPKGDASQIAVLTAVGPSYGEIYDTATRGGASGGPWFTDNGTSFGLTTAASELGSTGYTVEEAEKAYGVDIQGERSDYVQVTFVQPVNETVVQHISHDKHAAPVTCK